MADPTLPLTTAINGATKVANTPLFSTVIDKVLGFKISEWAAEGEVRKRQIHDEYEKAKNNGLLGVQYVSVLRSTTNLIEVATKSAEHIDPTKSNDIKMDNDFFWNMIEHAKSVSNEEMQSLIGKIIAGEYNTPGVYSMSTLQVIKMLGKSELELFEKICSLVLNSTEIPQELFFLPDSAKEFMKELALDFESLQELQNLGLFLPNKMERSIPNPDKKNFPVTYFGKQIVFSPENENHSIIKTPGVFGLSVTGRQILKHLQPRYIDKYFSWIRENYKIPNYKVVV